MSSYRYLIQSVHANPGNLTITYYDPESKLQGSVTAGSAMLSKEEWAPLNAALSDMVTLLLYKQQVIHPLGEPFPVAIIEPEEPQ